MRKQTWFQTISNRNRAVQTEMTDSLRLEIYMVFLKELEGLYYPCSEVLSSVRICRMLVF